MRKNAYKPFVFSISILSFVQYKQNIKKQELNKVKGIDYHINLINKFNLLNLYNKKANEVKDQI